MTDGRALSSRREVSLVEILDRALGSGIVISGDLTISLADVDLVYLDLRLLVGSVGTITDSDRYSGTTDVQPAACRYEDPQ
jgi:hypothetical protein